MKSHKPKTPVLTKFYQTIKIPKRKNYNPYSLLSNCHLFHVVTPSQTPEFPNSIVFVLLQLQSNTSVLAPIKGNQLQQLNCQN